MLLLSCSDSDGSRNSANDVEIVEQKPNLDTKTIDSTNTVELKKPDNLPSSDKQDLLNNDSNNEKGEQNRDIFNVGSGYDVDGINPFDIVIGNKDSNVRLIVYSSLTCSACGYYHENVFNKIKENYIDTNKIAYILRLFIGNKQDFDASILAMCDRAKFSPFVDVLYSRHQSWAFAKNHRDILVNIGQLGGVGPEQYNTCLADEGIKEGLITQSKELKKKFGNKAIGTPAFILNGTILSNSYSVKALSEQIDKLLAQ